MDLAGLLVGYGSIGRRHLANLHRLGVESFAVVHSGAGTLPYEPPCPVRTYSRLDDALRAETPSFAVVANPTAMHVPTALACVEHGCDLLLEKPVSHTLDGLDALRDAVARHGRRVLVGFQFRHDPGLRRVAELVRARAVGEPLHARVVWGEHLPSWHPWEDWRGSYAARADLGGGVHHTLCHPFDYLHMLFGEPVDLTASLTDHGPLGLEIAEAADVTLRFAEGVSAQVHLDYWGRPTTHRTEIVCSQGTIVWDYLLGEVRRWDDEQSVWCTERVPGVAARDELFVSEARHLLDVVARRAEPVCTLEDGARALRTCVEIEQAAARTGILSPGAS